MKTNLLFKDMFFFSRSIKVFIFLFSLLIGGNAFGQTTIHTNDCSAATSLWTFTNGTTTQAIQQGGYWLVEDNDVIISQAFDVSTYTGGVSLDFQVGTYGSGSPDNPLVVDYSVNNGTTWSSTTFTSATPSSSSMIASGTFVMPASTATQFKFRFRKTSTGRQGVRLDNIVFKSIPSYTVTFNGNASTSGTMAAQTAGPATNLTANAFSRTGYNFGG